MNDIQTIHRNDLGLAFQWKNHIQEEVQIVFRDMGFSLQLSEIQCFMNCVERAIQSSESKSCYTCYRYQQCRNILLQTPFKSLDLAVTKDELYQLKDLFSGVLFHLKLRRYIENEGRN